MLCTIQGGITSRSYPAINMMLPALQLIAGCMYAPPPNDGYGFRTAGHGLRRVMGRHSSPWTCKLHYRDDFVEGMVSGIVCLRAERTARDAYVVRLMSTARGVTCMWRAVQPLPQKVLGLFNRWMRRQDVLHAHTINTRRWTTRNETDYCMIELQKQ